MKEELYAQFTEHVLPKVQEGLVITKDYAFDLFERYITYLIVTDSLLLALNVVIFISAISTAIWAMKQFIKTEDEPWVAVVVVMFFPIALSFAFAIHTTGDLIKDIYIPEIRIIEEIKGINHE